MADGEPQAPAKPAKRKPPTVSVEYGAVKDEKGKFARLAMLLKLADSDHARGKCEHLWMACAIREEDKIGLPVWLVEQVLGVDGPAALVDAELASWTRTRRDTKMARLVMHGAEDHCDWKRLNRDQASKGGKSRAKTASRSAGRFTSGDQPVELAANQPIPFPDPLPLPEEERNHKQASARDLPPQVTLQPPHPVTTPHTVQSPTRQPTYDHTDPRSRGRLAETVYRRVSEAAQELAGELGLQPPLPFPAIGPSSAQRLSDALERVREEGAQAPAACDRFVSNLIAQARETRSIDWLAEKSFSLGAWRTALRWQPGQTVTQRVPPRSGAGRAPVLHEHPRLQETLAEIKRLEALEAEEARKAAAST